MQNTFLTIFAAIFGSVGFWTLVNNLITRRYENKSWSSKMLLGLGHDKICELSLKYINRGSISADEYEDLIKYLYKPYEKLGGDGTAERLITEVKKLPITEQKG